MKCVDLFGYNWATLFKSAGSIFWNPWKVSYFPLNVITGFSEGGKWIQALISNSSLGQLLEQLVRKWYMPFAYSIHGPQIQFSYGKSSPHDEERNTHWNWKTKKKNCAIATKKADQVRVNGILCGLEDQ